MLFSEEVDPANVEKYTSGSILELTKEESSSQRECRPVEASTPMAP